MTTRMTRAAAAAAAAQADLDTATNMALPSSPATITGLEDVTNTYLSSPLETKRSTSGSKLATVQIAEDAEAANVTAPRPGSPAVCAVLKPSGKAKQLINRERSGMRMSSNKENMKPQGIAAAEGFEAGNAVANERIGEPAAADATEPVIPAAVAPAILQDRGSQDNENEPAVAEPLPLKEVALNKDTTQTKVAPKADRRASRAPTQRPSTAAGLKAGPNRRSSVVIPHSKPRPMSMAFPTPPPPAKSSKTPTRPTFALPGEAVAAKLKAAREARLAKAAPPPATAEPEKRPAFKARPAPKMVPDATKVRTTAASRAREELMFPGRRATIADPRRASSVMDRRAPTPAIGRQSLAPSAMDRRALTPAQGRQSMVSSSMSAGRPSMGPARTDKGREVYGRAAAGLLQAKQAQKDKEEAAKRARAEAAERGRLASKEWAEKQQRKMLAAKKGKEAETIAGGGVSV